MLQLKWQNIKERILKEARESEDFSTEIFTENFLYRKFLQKFAGQKGVERYIQSPEREKLAT